MPSINHQERVCACGKRYKRDGQFNRHLEKCKRALDIERRTYQRGSHIWAREEQRRGRVESDPFRKRYGVPQDLGEGRSHYLPSETDRSFSEGYNTAQASNERVSPCETSHNDCHDNMQYESPVFDVPMSVDEPTLPDKRQRRPTAKVLAALEDSLPEGPAPFDEAEELPSDQADASRRPRVLLHVHERVQTLANSFGLSRIYRRRPTRIPDMGKQQEEYLATNIRAAKERKKRKISDIIFPYPNVSAFFFNRWFKSGSKQKSDGERDLLKEIVGDEDFRGADIQNANFAAIDKQLAKDVQSPWGGNGWTSSTVTVEVPLLVKQTKATKQAQARTAQYDKRHDIVDEEARQVPIHKFEVPHIHHRSLLHILRSAIEDDPSSKDFHWHGFEERWQPPDPNVPSERVFGELYTSEAFLKAERELLSAVAEDDLPRVIAAIMVWSDATHVAQFGQAKMWPIYLFFGNLSKYLRCRPSSKAAHHLAFLPSLPDAFEDFLKECGVKKSDPLMAHCRRELFHGVWKKLLDDDFIHAMEHGIVMKCADGITRRVFPRIFTYSADYPEKVLISGIRDMGGCPSPRVTTPKDMIREVGTEADKRLREASRRRVDDELREKVAEARKLIYEKGYVINSEKVENLLKPRSLVPTENAFSERLAQFLFQVYDMLVVDQLHEVELRVWKALIIHLIRILNTMDASKTQEFNARFRQVSPFGRDTIRHFGYNVSEMKSPAARDFEDILQCCIPCFEGLLDEPHNSSILDLLYLTAYWHSLAKLRQHTESSVGVLEEVHKAFSNCIRNFAEVTCTAFETVETDSEYSSRKRAEARRSQQGKTNNVAATSTGKKPRKFSLATYKLYATGGYPEDIKHFGTTDSYSTQIGELEHRVVKDRYARTNKNNAIAQVIKQDVISTVHDRMLEELVEAQKAERLASAAAHARDEPETELGDTDLMKHHHIALAERQYIHLRDLTSRDSEGDPAYKNFIPRLKQHLLSRLRGQSAIGEETVFDAGALNQLQFQHSRIYTHATASFNYTTYDVCRDQDTIHVGKNGHKRHIMVMSNDDDPDSHPFWYARVLGIYHANVMDAGARSPKAKRMEFLWVRWFGMDPEWSGGPSTLRLDRVGYIPEHDESGAFGFVDPSHVLRACHLIPAFNLGKTDTLLSYSTMRDFHDGDWTNYYIMRFVDRDMMMRYLGLGIGHINPANFPREDHQLRRDVLIENHKEPWSLPVDVRMSDIDEVSDIDDQSEGGFSDREDDGDDDSCDNL